MTKENEIARAITDAFTTEDARGEYVNIVDALLAIAEALNNCARWLDKLGFNDNGSHMGGLEGLSVMVKEGLNNIAMTINCEE
jgi:hypothetical protein